MINLIKIIIVRHCRDFPMLWRLIPSIQKSFKQKFSGKNIPKTVRTKHRFKMKINVGDFIGRHIYLFGDYESSVSKLFLSILEEGNNVIDIGANIGYYSLLSSSAVGENGKVFSFEASPLIYSKLQENIALNNAENIYAKSAAVGDKKGEVILFEADESHLGISSLRRLEGNNSREIHIEMITLNSSLSQFPTINLIKVDVEGAEMKVFKGIESIINRDFPFLIFEVTDHMLNQLGSSKTELLNWVREKGYDLYQIGDESLGSIHNEKRQFNALAVPKSKTDFATTYT